MSTQKTELYKKLIMLAALKATPTPPVKKHGPRNLKDAPVMCGPAMGCESKWFRINAAVKASEPTEIVIYDTIGKDWWSDRGVEASAFAEELRKIPRNQEILVRINSPGGSVADGLLIYNLLAERRAHVVCQVDSLAASIASVILLAGREVRVPRNARVMVHNPWTFAEGDSRVMRQVADKLDVHRDSIAVVYEKKTGRTIEEIHQWMDAETWMTGDAAKENGFADTVTDEEISFQACARFDLSNFKRVPEQLTNKGNKKENNMNREQIIAELKKLGITFDADATDDQLQALLGTAQVEAKNKAKAAKAKAEAKAKAAAKTELESVEDEDEEEEKEDEDEEEEDETPKPSNRLRHAPRADAGVHNRLKAIEAKYAAERKTRISAAVEQCVNEDRIPAAQMDKWVTRALADESVLDDLRAMEPRRPGIEPLGHTIDAGASPQNIEKGLLALRQPLESFMRGNNVDPLVMSNHARALSAGIDKHRKQLSGILNTNTIHTDLKRSVILNDVMRAFIRRLLILNVFTTKFENVPLLGTNKVQVPFYDLDTAASTDYVAATGYTFAEDTQVGIREISVNRRKYKTMDFTSDTFRRQPYFKPDVSMGLKAEQLAVDVWTDILSVVTAANFNTVALAVEAGAFDTDDMVTLRKHANNADWPDLGRACVLGTDHEAALLTDDAIKHFQNSNSDGALRDGATGKLSGFDMYYSPRIPTNSEDLAGFICLPQAALVATAPIMPAPGVRQQLLKYEIVIDPQTGIAFEYRYGADVWKDTDREVIECNYGYARGNSSALQRVTAGSNEFSSSSSQSSANSSSSSST